MLRRRARPGAWLIVGLAGVVTAACGYALAGRGSFLPDDIRIVAIPPVENGTAVAGLEDALTERIRDEFIGRGRYTMQAGTTGAHAVLRVAILDVTRTAVATNDQQLASRYLYTVTLNVTFARLPDEDVVIWRNEALSHSAEFELSTSALDGTVVDQRRSSFERMAGDVARSVVTAIMEAF